MGWEWVRFGDDLRALHLLCTLFLLHQLHLRSSVITSQRLGTPALADPCQGVSTLEHSPRELELSCYTTSQWTTSRSKVEITGMSRSWGTNVQGLVEAPPCMTLTPLMSHTSIPQSARQRLSTLTRLGHQQRISLALNIYWAPTVCQPHTKPQQTGETGSDSSCFTLCGQPGTPSPGVPCRAGGADLATRSHLRPPGVQTGETLRRSENFSKARLFLTWTNRAICQILF